MQQYGNFMRIRLLTCLFILSLCAPVSAQTVRIKTILDSNLFETFDGKIIKLAGVDAPSKNHPAPYMRDVAERACIYAKTAFLNRHFSVVPLLPKDTTKDYELVFMQKDYPLGPIDYNKEYLLEGFGRFTGRVPDAFFTVYNDAEQEARKKENGIWKYIPGDSVVVLDRQFSPEEAGKFRKNDSILFIQGSFKRKGGMVASIGSELVLAPISGFTLAYFSAFASGGLSVLGGAEGLGVMPYALLGVAAGYTAGAAIAVYFIAHHDNPNVTFYGTLGSALLGTGAGFLAASCVHPGPEQYYLFFAGPVVGSIVYANFIVPEPQFSDYYPASETYSLKQKSYTHKDLYNSTVLYNVNLINIAF